MPVFHCFARVWITFLLVLTHSPLALTESILELDVADRGVLTDVGERLPGVPSTVGFGVYGSETTAITYLAFDLSGITQPVDSVKLNLEVTHYRSTRPEEVLTFHGYSDLSGALLDSHPGDSDLWSSTFTEMISGEVYGSYAVTGSDEYTTLNIPLNQFATQAVNAKLGGQIIIGVSLFDPSAEERYIYMGAGYEPPTQTLVLGHGDFYSLSLSPLYSMGPPVLFSNDQYTVRLFDIEGQPVYGEPITINVQNGHNEYEFTLSNWGSSETSYFGFGSRFGKGIDRIVAVYEDTEKFRYESPVATKVWDYDCNENAIPDTCDISCVEFDGECLTEFQSCGTSFDVDTNDVPDECNQPPICDSAVASTDTIWPPNHQSVDVTIEGVTDPEDDAIAITITRLHQDEPTNAVSGPNTCPDAGRNGSVASLLAERANNGDGRVYWISFLAEDGRGGSCTGRVEVCVPRDRNTACGVGEQIHTSSRCIISSHP